MLHNTWLAGMYSVTMLHNTWLVVDDVCRCVPVWWCWHEIHTQRVGSCSDRTGAYYRPTIDHTAYQQTARLRCGPPSLVLTELSCTKHLVHASRSSLTKLIYNRNKCIIIHCQALSDNVALIWPPLSHVHTPTQTPLPRPMCSTLTVPDRALIRQTSAITVVPSTYGVVDL